MPRLRCSALVSCWINRRHLRRGVTYSGRRTFRVFLTLAMKKPNLLPRSIGWHERLDQSDQLGKVPLRDLPHLVRRHPEILVNQAVAHSDNRRPRNLRVRRFEISWWPRLALSQPWAFPALTNPLADPLPASRSSLFASRLPSSNLFPKTNWSAAHGRDSPQFILSPWPAPTPAAHIRLLFAAISATFVTGVSHGQHY